jgi:D-3-phosphoglycerate dehydrogenase / 2-oxoglutarate reductase
VNVSAAEASETVRPFLPLAERLGELYSGLAERVPDVLEIEYAGQLADYDTRILTLSVLKGVFGRVTDEPVSYVNAPRIASERGVEVRDTSTATAHDYINLVTIRGGDHAIAGTLVGLRAEPRIVMLDGHTTDLPPAKNMLVVRNDDRPGMIAFVAGVLADAGVNIDDMHLGRSDRGEAAVQVIATDVAVPPEVRDAIRAGDGVVSVHVLS